MSELIFLIVLVYYMLGGLVFVLVWAAVAAVITVVLRLTFRLWLEAPTGDKRFDENIPVGMPFPLWLNALFLIGGALVGFLLALLIV